MQDLINPERRSVRNISIDKPKVLSENTAATTDVANESDSMNRTSSMQPQPPFGKIGGRSRTTSKWWWIGGGAIALIIVILIIGGIFSGAKITITPRQTAVSLDSTITAYANPVPGDVGFEIITVSKDATRTVKATGSERIDRPASGTIVIFNDFSEEPQRLIVNTRFQTPEGLVYRIQESVTVPGKRSDGTPGSVEARVFADETGERHNIDLADFTIPGFKEGGDLERFEKFYARSKTPMTGGFSGTVPVANEADTEAAIAALEASLTEALAAEAGTTLPKGFVIIPNSASYSFETLPNTEGPDGAVIITVRGESRLFAINSIDIARDAAASRIQGYTGEPVAFDDPTQLSFAFADTQNPQDPTATSTEIRVTGLATLIWTFDTDELSERLVGVSRSDTQEIFRDYPGIERADVVVRPFWKRSLPNTTEKITIKVESALK